MDSFAVLIVAAGSSSRMQGVDKQFIPLAGKPLLLHSVLAFCAISEVCELVLVLHAQNIAQGTEMMAHANIARPYQLVCGGNTRQESALKGLSALNSHANFIAVHDGARPLLQKEQILAVFADAKQYGAATLGVPVKDTLKRCDTTGFFTHTINRNHLFCTQTPQVFRRDLYEQAVACAGDMNDNNCTDDAQLLERINHPVYMTEGDTRNIKITTPTDLDFAAYYLSKNSHDII